MREILFRGKRIDKNNPANNGKWFEGVYFPENDITPAIIYGGTRHNHGVFVDPNTVGQYTGLTDKNGKRIFEGDVVARYWLGSLKKYIIVYEEKDAMFIGDCINASGFTTFDRDGYEFEVIGNIHDNPELVEVE